MGAHFDSEKTQLHNSLQGIGGVTSEFSFLRLLFIRAQVIDGDIVTLFSLI